MGPFGTKGVIQQAAEHVDTGQLLKALARTALDQSKGNGQVSQVAAEAASGRASRPLGAAAQPGLMVAGGVAGITAASAAISAVRRKQGT